MKKDDIVDAEIVEETQQYKQRSAGKMDDNSAHGGEIKDRLLSAEPWLRFIFMVLFVVVAFAASYVVLLLIIVQFVFALFTGRSDEKLQLFGASLSKYLFQILSFLTYNTEQKPYPFADWPETALTTDNQSNASASGNI